LKRRIFVRVRSVELTKLGSSSGSSMDGIINTSMITANSGMGECAPLAIRE
jgi:hypothetical protein